jgi:hypothetical protein
MTEDSRNEISGTSAETGDAVSNPTGTTIPLLELNEVFAGLSHPRRRYLLYTLVNGSSEAPLPELAANIAGWEREKPVGEVTDEEQQDVYISLYHCHVPRLSKLGIVDYQEGENIIVRAANTDQVKAVLDGAGAELDFRQETHARDIDTSESE